MDKNSALNRLFTEWRKSYDENGIDYSGFSSDGIIDESQFSGAKPRVLFILRETNDFPGDQLRRFLNENLKWQIWRTISRWAYGILNGFPEYAEIDDQVLHAALCQTAVMNLKKITGRSSADLDEINESAHRDKEFILREVDIIDPQVIVACGTRGHLVWLLDLHDLPRKDKLPVSIYQRNGTARLFLFTRHPVRANNKETYMELRRCWNKVDGRRLLGL